MRIDPNNEVFTIDKINCAEEFFPNIVRDYLKRYVDYLRSIDFSAESISRIQVFARNINVCLNDYYCGQHDSAQYFFRNAINSIGVDRFYRKVVPNVFYRARKNETQTLFRPDEMFHICFEKRYLVGTQRYSYPGLPCLYLGSSVEVCCEELNCRDNKLNIAQIQKKTSDDIYIFDLYFFEEYDFLRLSEEDEARFVELWPLVACCSFTYLDANEMTFRPDYIIPQLLLEYVIDKSANNDMGGCGTILHGIRYHSVKIPLLKTETNHEKSVYINYVFPALTNEPTGFCEVLQDIFSVKQIFPL